MTEYLYNSLVTPNAVPDMTLVAAIDATQTTLVVSAVPGNVTTANFRIRIDNEIMTVTAMTGVTWAVTRASENSAQLPAAPHALGANIYLVLTEGALTAHFAALPEPANTVLAGPTSGPDAVATYRSLVVGDIPSLPGSIIGSGTVAAAQLGSGSPTASTFLRGDNSWSALAAADIPNISAGLLTSGTVAAARFPTQLNPFAVGGALPTGPNIAVVAAPGASANYGNVSIGSGPWDGSTTGFYVGSASGTQLAMNAATGYAGYLALFQIAGVDRLLLLSNGALHLRNGISAAQLNIWNTWDGVANGERFQMLWSGNAAFLITKADGTGTARTLAVGTEGAAAMFLRQNGTNRWSVDTSGHFMAVADNTYDIGASGATRPRTVYIGTSILLGTTATITTLRQPASNTLQIGAANSATPGANTLVVGESARPGTDSNTAGASGVLQPGAGTGTGATTPLIFKAPIQVASGTGVQTQTEFLRGQAVGTSIGIGFLGSAAVVQQTRGATLTNSVTSGGTDDTIANFTDLTIYANDAATIRNDIYQLARALRQHDVALRAYGLLS